MRHTGIHIIGDVPWGTHFCQFYQEKQDLIDILIPYFKSGLENNEFCMWVTSEPLRAQEAQDALMKEIPNLEDYIHKGQIEILDYGQWYTAGGCFESDRVLQGWVGKLDAAVKRGWDGLRLTGNTFWLEKSDWQDFTDYEATVDGVIGRYRMLAICTYSLAKCGAAEIMDVVANHAFALIKRADQWQVIQNSERKRDKASLRASEERYLSLFEQMTEGFALHEIICDEDGAPCDYRFLEINPAFERLTGLKRTDALGKSMREVMPDEDPKWVEIYGAVALTGETVRFEKYSPELKRHFNVLAFRPAPRQFAVLVTDITQRKEVEAVSEHRRMEDGLRTASLYARSLLEASLDPLVTISPAGKITDVNQATELVTGVPRDRLIGTSFSEYFTAPRQAEEGYHKVLSNGLVRDYPLTIRHVAGHTTDVLYNATVYRNEAGEVQGVFAAARDVTERKRLEEEVRVASLYARSLIEASLDPLVTISPEGQITDVNETTELATGVPRGRLIGSDFSDYFTEPDQARAGYQKVLSDGLIRDYPLTIRNLAGHTTDVLYNAVVYCDEAGQVQGVFAAARDVTERKRAEAELARYRDHLEELVRQRTSELETANTHLQRTTAELVRSNQELEQFAYVASHDLQEPLRAVTGYLGLIEQQLGDELDKMGRHHVAGAVQGAARMHTLITDLLALSRVGSRGQAFESADLNTVLD